MFFPLAALFHHSVLLSVLCWDFDSMSRSVPSVYRAVFKCPRISRTALASTPPAAPGLRTINHSFSELKMTNVTVSCRCHCHWSKWSERRNFSKSGQAFPTCWNFYQNSAYSRRWLQQTILFQLKQLRKVGCWQNAFKTLSSTTMSLIWGISLCRPMNIACIDIRHCAFWYVFFNQTSLFCLLLGSLAEILVSHPRNQGIELPCRSSDT